MIRHAILAAVAIGTVAVGSAGMAGAQQAPGLQVYLDLDRARALVTPAPANPQTQAAMASLRSHITSLQTSIQTKTAELQRNSGVWSEAQMVKAQRDLSDLQDSLISLRGDLDSLIEDARYYATKEADLKIGRAMQDYAAQNKVGVVVTHRSGVNEEGIIVLNPQFEIATAISEMEKSGPGAFAPPHPRRAPVVKYADLSRLFGSTYSHADATETQNRIVNAARDKGSAMQNEAARWENIARLGSPTEQAEAQARLELLHLQIEMLQRDTNRDSEELSARFAGLVRQEITEVIMRNSAAFGADVLRLEEDFGEMTIADPALDVTTALSNMMKVKP